jgi:hypothetical protein
LKLNEAAMTDITGISERNILTITVNDFDGDGKQDLIFSGFSWTEAGPTFEKITRTCLF